jgi:hypothetical protein
MKLIIGKGNPVGNIYRVIVVRYLDWYIIMIRERDRYMMVGEQNRNK